jgi:hypothetical protein
MVSVIQTQQEELKLPEPELVQCVWQGLMATIDWSARPDQIEGLAMREITVSWPCSCFSRNTDRRAQKYAPVLEPFCNGAKTEVALINVVQVYCYEDTRMMKSFANIIKVSCVLDSVESEADAG